jgi:anti-sigma factor RsiW
MNCPEAALDLERHLDGELGRLRRIVLERHLRACPRCAAQRTALGELRARIRNEVPRHVAPPALRERVESLIAAQRPRAQPVRPGRPWTWLSAGAAAGCAATLLAFVATTQVADWRRGHDMVAEVVERHVRATLADRRIQVASSDRHTVKPWLSDRLDYSPAVRDLADQGFPLAGARIDVVDGRRVATLVYKRREHWIDVVVVPAGSGGRAVAPSSVRGFNVLGRRAADMDWIFVSDVGAAELGEFADRLAAQVAQP